ncbi:MAG: MFS transporter [Clostridiales bacterium]|nr:MFS transporter [Clostridiales bacterium]
MALPERITNTVSNVKTYWRRPPEGRYMTFKEIGSYAIGGIGAYFIIQLGSTLIVSTTNTIVNNAIGVRPSHSYIIYLIATLLNIPLTGIRANMVDNTRGKEGKYRPYLLSMGIPTVIIALIYVWFPYRSMYRLLPGTLFGHEKGYLITLAVVFTCNLALYFFFNFFRDAYENLIHVLSPNTQERTDVLAIKAVVYSLAPSIMNIVNPLIAQFVTNNDQTNILVYRITYPIYAVIGIALTIVVWANTKEKIVQAKTHTIQVRFIDAFKEVAKNKYFWIIAFAGWLGFLELAYQNILFYYQSYAMDAKGEHIIEGGPYALATTIIGNASLWGMLFAPFFIKKFGKKKVLVSVNLMNVVCILLMLVNFRSFWWLVVCVWINSLFGSVEQITSPAIQADIRDYQQYKSGERIDGMFATVATIGGMVTLATSAVLPAVQEKFGIHEHNGYDKPFDILNTFSGKEDLLFRFLPVLIIMAAVGAFLNVVPYFFYDFNEKKQKSVIRVLKVRALFEDYSNGALSDENLVEAIELVNNARDMAGREEKIIDKSFYTKASDKSQKKALKKEYKEILNQNEEIEISRFVCAELDKFNKSEESLELSQYREIYHAGLDGIKTLKLDEIKAFKAQAKAMPKNTADEKAERKAMIEIANGKLTAYRAYNRYYNGKQEFVEPDIKILEECFDNEDRIAEKLDELFAERKRLKKESKKEEIAKINEVIKANQLALKEANKESKEEMDCQAYFNRAAKIYCTARRVLAQEENYQHYDEIAAMYDEATQRVAEQKAERDAEIARLEEADRQLKEQLKAEKEAKKKEKKNK